MAEQTDASIDHRTEQAEERTDLSLVRTRLALERTLAAWIRTTLAMIGFGFTIYKFLQELQQKQAIMADRPYAARNFGLSLIAMGTVATVFAVYQHVTVYGAIGLHPLKRPVSISLIVACFIVLLGVLVLVGIAARIGPF